MKSYEAVGRCILLNCLAILIVPSSAYAQNKIIKISEKYKRVGISLDKALKKGDMLEAKTSGESCILEVIKVTDTMAVADTKCAQLSKLVVGQKVTNYEESINQAWAAEVENTHSDEEDLDLPDEEPPVKAKTKKKPKKKINVGLSLLFSLADKIESKGTINSQPFTETDITEGAPGFSLQYVNVPKGKLGSFVTIDYELSRKIKTLTVKLGNTTVYFDSDASLTIIDLASNLAYGFTDNFFAYGGINWPFAMNTKDTEVSYRGVLGFQGGLGLRFDQGVFGAIEYRVLNAKGTYEQGTLKGTYDEVSFDGMIFRLGYVF